ncbi:RAMP superfamily CRISPR-associated protein [Saccharomonospora azurea]|uniref:RAMP superfamily CRISPR-associated protein n=1 Tax=Saccharomonospora sp. NB11 TaxID=1642298 RepID=UPI0018D1B830|nr:RAMP superfamily CRISPR-associated protein [Saccharomonospora sp. NB11]
MTEMSTLEFEVRFHTPFRVSTGHARPGLDAGVDAHRPLPSSSLKGVMRATALRLLEPHTRVVHEVFGSSSIECPWLWHDAVPDNGWHQTRPAARVAVDSHTHAAKPDMLAVTEQIGAETARFTIAQRHPLDKATLQTHRLVLAVAGQATRSLGADRRRGLGWVTITCTTEELDQAAVERFLALRSA